MYHIVASDLDGTLLSPEHRLTPFACKTLQKLVEYGIHFVFATGRHYVDVKQIRDTLGIPAYMITSNGARVHNTDDKLVCSHNLDVSIVNELYTLKYNDTCILTHVYCDDAWFINRHYQDEQNYFQESVFPYQVYQLDMLPTNEVGKIFFTCKKPQLLLPLKQVIKARWGNHVNVSFSLPTCLEVTAGGVSKGNALKIVTKNLGYELKACIAFGDGMNDVEMLSMVGKGYIMDNAYQCLKDTLPTLEVIGSNADDSVAHMLQNLILVKKMVK